ncbi:MAG TPA: glycosyltransferase family 4 protein [Dehalococcoidia bacterium]
MRVLFITANFPFPPDSGAALKTLSVFDYLRRRHDVRAVAIIRTPLTASQEIWAAERGVQTVLVNRGRSPGNLIRSYLGGRPLSVERNRSVQMKVLVEEKLAAGLPDAVFVDGWLVAQYLPEWFSGLKLLHQHNAEYRLWELEAAKRGLGPLRWLAGREAARVRKYEAKIMSRFDAVFAVSVEDARALVAIGADRERVDLLPNVPDPALLDLPSLSFEQEEPELMYFGTLSWQPNIDGLERLITRVLPLVRERIPEIKLTVAGRNAPRRLIDLAERTPGVQYAGPLEDAEPLYQRARVFVEVTQTGGGTRLKILNALARGLPTVASVAAAQGLDIVTGDHLLVARDDDALAEAIVLLLTDEERWRIVSQNGRALVRGKYVAEVAFQSLDRILARDEPPPDVPARRRGRRRGGQYRGRRGGRGRRQS